MIGMNCHIMFRKGIYFFLITLRTLRRNPLCSLVEHLGRLSGRTSRRGSTGRVMLDVVIGRGFLDLVLGRGFLDIVIGCACRSSGWLGLNLVHEPVKDKTSECLPSSVGRAVVGVRNLHARLDHRDGRRGLLIAILVAPEIFEADQGFERTLECQHHATHKPTEPQVVGESLPAVHRRYFRCGKTYPKHTKLKKMHEHHDIHDILQAVHKGREVLVENHGEMGRRSRGDLR